MKILFVLGATSRIRNFRDSILALAAQGHTLQLTGRPRGGVFELPPGTEHERVSARINPTRRADAWGEFVELLRGARDYVRYFDPRFGQASRLKRRAYEIAPTDFVLFCERHEWIKRHWRTAGRLLAWCEDLIPVDRGFEDFVREERPDLMLVTPLVTFESYQTDYVKVAHRLGIPVAFLPFSWDNLTNKGLVRVQPDRVFVWNEIQKREAIELHGCRSEDVVVTGAERFDGFFALQPATTREAFLAERGLDPRRPLILYLGSSQLTGPNEMELIRRWAESIRASRHECLRTANLLIRPHPALRRSYASLTYSDLGGVAFSLESKGDQELFDSLFHAHAAVGLNTSAMLEAAIVGRPVHTLVMPGFDEGQIGTMHFHYLVEAFGGLATIARDFEEHHHQLAGVLSAPVAVSPRSRHFAEQFLRPHGIGRPVQPIVTAEIVRAAAIQKRPVRPGRIWHAPARRLLLSALSRRRSRAEAPGGPTVITESQSLRPVRTAIEEILGTTGPVFVGPWNDSVANEVLYWIPFLRWLVGTYRLPADRLIVLSRDGVAEWYGTIADRYVDTRSLFSASELEQWQQRTVPQSEQNPKLAKLSPLDTEIMERAARVFDLSDFQVIHPSMLFRVLARLARDRTTNEQLPPVLRHERLRRAAPNAVAGLPDSYVAVSVAFSDGLPSSDENAALLQEIVEGLVAERDVVIVDASIPSNMTLPPSPRVHRLDRLADGKVPVDLQARVLLRAAAFVGGYGDTGVLAAFCGVPTVLYHSARIPDDAEERLRSAAASGEWGTVSIQRARRFKGVRLPVEARVR